MKRWEVNNLEDGDRVRVNIVRLKGPISTLVLEVMDKEECTFTLRNKENGYRIDLRQFLTIADIGTCYSIPMTKSIFVNFIKKLV